jgi:hypothetical protein
VCCAEYTVTMISIRRQRRGATPGDTAQPIGDRPAGWATERLWLMTRYALEDIGPTELVRSADVAEADAAVGGYERFTGRAHEPLAALIFRCADLQLCVVMYGEIYPALKAVLVDDAGRPLCGTEPFRLPAFHWTTGSWERLGKPMRPRQRRAYRESVRHQFMPLTTAVQEWRATWQAWGVTTNDEAIAHMEHLTAEAAQREAAMREAERAQRERAELLRREREADEIRQRLRMYLSAGVTPPEELVAAAEGEDAPTDALP